MITPCLLHVSSFIFQEPYDTRDPILMGGLTGVWDLEKLLFFIPENYDNYYLC